MEESATQLVPVEIWTIILRQAVATPNFPFIDKADNHPNYGSIYGSLLFCDDCVAYRESRKMRQAITALQLVCRLWASILSNYRVCIFTDRGICSFPGRALRQLKGVERIYMTAQVDGQAIIESLPCSCSLSFEKPCLFDLQYQNYLSQYSVGWWEGLWDEQLKELLLGVRMLSLVLDGRKIAIEKLISLMPTLQAIRIRFDPKDNVPGFSPFPTLFSRQSQLTHLELSRLTWTSFYFYFFPLTSRLQTLRYLKLSFSWAQERSPIAQNIKWDFRGLNTLAISGVVHLGVKEEILEFVRQCGATFTEFVDQVAFVQQGTIQLSTGALQEEQFPRLRTYGTQIGYIKYQLDSAPQIEPKSCCEATLRRSLILYGTKSRSRFRNGLTMGQLISYMKIWGFDRAILPERWSDLKTSSKEKDSSAPCYYEKVSRWFMETDLMLLDRDGIDVRDPRCDRFWEKEI
ncbi:hypothetical protein CPB86DRAFT_789308 [Serendipita vermifera]|nr:hypothetical protein CPB86DRAFT_789308 [Serendipita vermifera]